MSLFIKPTQPLKSGKISLLKIDCDALQIEDYNTLASLIDFKFRKALGIPRGGTAFATALQSKATGNPEDPYLIVDDVFTTGESMEAMKKRLIDALYLKEEEIKGIVVFSRGQTPDWILPIFQLTEHLQDK